MGSSAPEPPVLLGSGAMIGPMKLGNVICLAVLLALAVTACAAPYQGSSEASRQPTIGKKQIVVAILGDPAGLHQEMLATSGTGTVPGLQETFQMLDGALTHLDTDQVRQPELAEAVPTVENGLWKVLPDGRMETTWRLQPSLTWQDGTPMTAEDLRFTLEVYRDPLIGVGKPGNLAAIDGIDVPDPQTAVVRWQKIYIDADQIFSSSKTMWPLPKHLLEQSLEENKEGFLGLPYWREGFVGAGSFKMQDWASGSHMTLIASDSFVLGRPRLDELQIRFFTDRRALLASVLSGSVHTFIGHGLYPEDILTIQRSGQDVRVQTGGILGGPAPIYPQFINPDPPIVANQQFRRALLMAIDRQQMTDTINFGLGPVAHSWVSPDTPEGRAVEGSIVRYPYDPRAAAQLIEGLRYTKGADGMLQDADGKKLSVQILTVELNALNLPSTLAVKDYWEQLGVGVTTDVLPAVRVTDRQARALFPAFSLIARGVQTPEGTYTTSAIPRPENNFIGGNLARYGSPELDAIIGRYLTTIPFQARMAALGDMVHHQTDLLTIMPLLFAGEHYVLGPSRLKNVQGGQVWNAYRWDLES